MEVEGKIIEILPALSGVGQKGEWTSQDYVLETNENYPRNVCFSVFGKEKISQYDIQIGDVVNVSFNIESRKFKERWYTAIKAWKVAKMGSTPVRVNPEQPVYNQPATQTPQPSQPTQKSEPIDDLPF